MVLLRRPSVPFPRRGCAAMSHSHSSYRGEPGAFQPQGHVEQPCPKASERNGALRHIYVSANGWWNCGLCQYAPAPAAPAPRAEELTRNRVLLNKLLMARREASNIASGQNKWRMRIPAQPDDSDLLICGAFDEAIAEIDRLTASLARANEEREYSRKHGPHSDPADCPAWFDWCLCGTDNIAEIIARLRAEVAAAREALRYPAEWCRRALEDEPFVPHDSDRPGGNIVIHAKTGRDVAQTVVDAMNRLSPSPTPTEEQR